MREDDALQFALRNRFDVNVDWFVSNFGETIATSDHELMFATH